MSVLDTIVNGAREADKIVTRLSPWWSVIEPVIQHFEDGALTKEQFEDAVKHAMLQAKREQIAAGK